MDLGHKMLRHPARHELAGYAEALADKRPLDATVAAHVMGCSACAAEVQAIRASFEFTAALPELEPTAELTTRILLEARARRTEAQRVLREGTSPLWFTLRATVCSAALGVFALFTFGAFLSLPTPGLRGTSTARGADPAAATAGQEALRRAVEQVKALSTAVTAKNTDGTGVLERERRRAAQAMAQDIAAAKVALDRNPYCLRAADLFQASLQRQAETLRQLYIERSL